MKLTFEGELFADILVRMREVLLSSGGEATKLNSSPNVAATPAQGPGPDPFDGEKELTGNAGQEPVEDKMAGLRAAKAAKAAQKAADEAAEKAKVAAEKSAAAEAAKAARKAARNAKTPAPEPKEEPEEKEKAKPGPVDMAAIRTKTVAELQNAYANGKHVEVMKLLAEFGNGAKSFRELAADAFLPIREAIDNGALA